MLSRCFRILPLLAAGLLGPAAVLEAEGPDAPPEAGEVAESPSEAAENLIRNGDFETPAEDGTHPAHWQAVDNLVFFWTSDPEAPDRGKVLRIDTDVYQRQAYAWWIDRFVHGEPLEAAPEKKQPTGKRLTPKEKANARREREKKLKQLKKQKKKRR